MKAKKFRVTLTVLSFAIFNILKYCSKMYYWLADWEFCSHKEDWGAWDQSPMSRSTWAESFKGSNTTAEFPGCSTMSKEDVVEDRTGKRWSSTRTWHCRGYICEPESLSARCFALPCCCLFWCSWWWQLSKHFSWKHGAVAWDVRIFLTPHLRMWFTLIALTCPSEEIWGPWVKEWWNLSSFQ